MAAAFRVIPLLAAAPSTMMLPLVVILAATEFASAPYMETVLILPAAPLPMAPLLVMAPWVLTVRVSEAPPSVPDTEARDTVRLEPAPTTRSTPLFRVVAARVMVPVEAPPKVASSVTVMALVPKLKTPVPAVLMLPAILLEDGAVAVTPLVKVVVSAAALPMVKVPILAKVTALVMAPPPVMAKLYPPLPTGTVKVGVVTAP